MSINYEKLIEQVRLLDEDARTLTSFSFPSENIIEFNVCLKDNRQYSMGSQWNVESFVPGSFEAIHAIENLVRSLTNTWNRDYHKFGDYIVDESVDFSMDYEVNQDYDPSVPMAEFNISDIDLNFDCDLQFDGPPYIAVGIGLSDKTFADYYMKFQQENSRTTTEMNTVFVTTTSPSNVQVCSTCADTGYVVCSIYGTYECPNCAEKLDKQHKSEKELSAWDKKLKEELDNGADTWGMISKKYKK